MIFISYAQNFEDVMLWRALKHIEHGFYIDVGAAWPDKDSVTRAFYERGWKGINVEPNPELLRQLRENRPRDQNLPLAVADSDGCLIINFVENEGAGLSTLDDAIADRHRQAGWSVKRQEVQVTSLNSVWLRYVPDGQDVHFLKVDVEGVEKAVLLGNDWTQNRPWIVVVEATLPNSQVESHEAWEPILFSASYRFAYADGINRFYVASERADLLPLLKYPPNVFDGFALNGQREAETRANKLQADLDAAHADLQAAHADLQATQVANHHHRQLAEAREQQIQAMYRSYSWRVTAPLRWMARLRALRMISAPVRLTRRTVRGVFNQFPACQIRILRRSGLFDVQYYLATNRDVLANGVDPLRHYLKRGWKEHLNPSPLFDTDWYLQQNPDVSAAGINPLLHFIEYGAAEGRAPRPLSSTRHQESDSSVHAQAELSAREFELVAQMTQQIEGLEKLTQALRSSLSWRLTAPLRGAGRLLNNWRATRKALRGIGPFVKKTPEKVNPESHDFETLSDIPPITAEFAACTIIAKNYLAMARVLAESFQQQNPGAPFFVLLVDAVDGRFKPQEEPFYVLEARQLPIPNLPGFFFKYNVLEVSTALKPYLLAHLFEKHNIKKLIYLDPDILVLEPLEEISRLLDDHAIVLTPHMTNPYLDSAKPDDHDILQTGTYNLGFIGLRRSESAAKLLAWWQKKLYHHCVSAPEQNLFVDQRWVDLVPGLFSDVFICREAGFNVAYWNLHERRVTIERDKVLVNGGPCYFFHFSGFNPEDTATVSKYQSRFKMSDLGDGAALFKRYARMVIDKGWQESKDWPYTYGRFQNGLAIPASARTYYWRLGPTKAARLGNPFAWANGTGPVSGAAPDKFVRDSQRKSLSFGVNVVGYVASEKGMGEAARSNLRILKATGIPYVANHFMDTYSANAEKLPANFSEHNPYSINLINVNADQVPYFVHTNPRYLPGHYNIGYWTWELSQFPPEWAGSFRYFDEVWVPSTFVQQSIGASSPIPVRTVLHSIDPETQSSPAWNRKSLDLRPDVFVFLFMFDFSSLIERKNPAGLIRAFKQAFGDRKDVLLLLKTSRSDQHKAAALILEREARGANVRIFGELLSREAVHSMMLFSDCYVSLHRSEGFGLTLSEAMMSKKPVIATGYSGNTDFMTEQNSFPVRYKLVEIQRDYGPYKVGNVWAEPDIAHAAQLMRHVFEDRAAAAAIAERAAADVMLNLHPSAIARVVKSRLEELATASLETAHKLS